MEAFSKHPRIGERKGHRRHRRSRQHGRRQEQQTSRPREKQSNGPGRGKSGIRTAIWSRFIVCATGRSAPEMLEILGIVCGTMTQPSSGKQRKSSERSRTFGLKKWLSK